MLSILLSRNPMHSRGFWITLILFAIFFGIFLARIAAPYHRADHASQWSQAVWVEPATDSAVAYYRREWNVDSKPTRAYLQVEAPDSFTVYVNGLKIGSVDKPSTSAFDLMDVGNYLLPGKNVIAVRVERKTFPGPASLRANLHWEEKTGLHQDLASDQKWRVALREERQRGGGVYWYENDFDGTDWVQVSLLKDPNGLVVHPVHPWAGSALFQAFPRGKWISNGRPATGGVGFVRQFDLGSLGSGEIRSAWLGVASTGSYALIINGARGPTIAPSGQYMDTYDIGSFLFSGINTIEIETSNFDGTGRIAVAAMVSTSRELLDFSSNENWRIRGYGAKLEPVAVMGNLESYPYTEKKTGSVFLTPILRLAEAWLPGGLLLRHFVVAIPWIVAVFLITLSIIVLRLSRGGVVSREIVTTCTLPWKLANLLLCGTFMLPFDVRISEAQTFTVPVALALAMLTYTLFSLIMSEIENGHP